MSVERSNKPSGISVPSPAPTPLVETSSDGSKVTATLPTGDSVTVSLFGATVLSWKSASGKENFWVSEKAVFDGVKAIRGGIPICFPIFGPPPESGPLSVLPNHGFARINRWEFLGKSDSEGPSVKLDFGLDNSMITEEQRKTFPYEFGLTYSVTLSPASLETVMHVQNKGKESFKFQLLLHNYFKIDDIHTATVTGVRGHEYLDKVISEFPTPSKDDSKDVKVDGVIDKVYYNLDTGAEHALTVFQSGKPRFEIIRDGLTCTTIWNPWDKCVSISDFGPADGWKTMLCVEPGEVHPWAEVEAGDAWEAGQLIKAL